MLAQVALGNFRCVPVPVEDLAETGVLSQRLAGSDYLVRESSGQGLLRREPCLLIQQAAELCFVNGQGPVLVAGQDGLTCLVQHVCCFTQFLTAAGHPCPRVVNHHQAVVGHQQSVAAGGGNTAGTPACTVNSARAPLAEVAQSIVDGDTVKQVAADGVEPHQHRRNAVVLLLQVANELAGGDSPEPDLAVNEYLDDLALLLPGSPDAVPVLCLQLRHAGGSVQHAPRCRGQSGHRHSNGQVVMFPHGLFSSSSLLVSGCRAEVSVL